TAVPTDAKVSISCHGVNNPGGGHDFPNALIARIRNKDVPRAVTEHTAGAMEFCTSGRAAVPAESKVSISCHGVNNPGGGIDFPDSFVQPIGTDAVPRSIHVHCQGSTDCVGGVWACVNRE